MLNRCPTRDRIIGWGLITTSPLCLLCNLEPESRNHLFFDCAFTWGIWSVLIRRCGLQPERIWSRVLEQLQGLSPRSPLGMLSLICWQACLYWSWTERNTRLHRQIFTSSQSLTRRIDRQIKDRILSLRSANPSTSSTMMQQWLSWYNSSDQFRHLQPLRDLWSSSNFVNDSSLLPILFWALRGNFMILDLGKTLLGRAPYQTEVSGLVNFCFLSFLIWTIVCKKKDIGRDIRMDTKYCGIYLTSHVILT